jgi:cytochrome c553
VAAQNMTNNYSLTIFGVLIVLAAPAKAAENSFGATLLVCNACHGDNGAPKDATIPVIWGQQENDLGKQLRDFVIGERNSEVMSWMVKSFSPEEVRAMAAFFREKGLAGAVHERRRHVAARRSGGMRNLSSAELCRRRGGTPARRPKLPISGRGNAPLWQSRADQQCRYDESHEGDFARRARGDGALHIGPLIGGRAIVPSFGDGPRRSGSRRTSDGGRQNHRTEDDSA